MRVRGHLHTEFVKRDDTGDLCERPRGFILIVCLRVCVCVLASFLRPSRVFSRRAAGLFDYGMAARPGAAIASAGCALL